MPAALIPVAVGAISGAVKNAQAKKQEDLAASIQVPDANYEDSTYAKNMLATAQQMNNARMPGAGNAEQNILGNQANAVGSVERNSTSGSQALQLIAGAQGQTNQAFNNLFQQEGNYRLNTANNLQTVNQAGADNSFQGQLRKQMLAIQQKNALGLAATQNKGNAMNDVMNGAMAGAAAYGGQENSTGFNAPLGSKSYNKAWDKKFGDIFY